MGTIFYPKSWPLRALPSFMAGAFLLCVVFTGTAHAFGSQKPKDWVERLNQQNIQTFLNEVKDFTTGQHDDMLPMDITNYFDNHIADNGRFKGIIKYDLPGFPSKDVKVDMGKAEYIGGILNGQYMVDGYETQVEITELKITKGGKAAELKTVTTERGKIALVKAKNMPPEIIPIQGESTCSQKLIVSKNHFIQLSYADCNTHIRFDPFDGSTLGQDNFFGR